MATYKFRVDGLYPVKAQAAGEELHRIFETYGGLRPEDVVEESRAPGAVLHGCFEWNDAKAAENYRIEQAGNLIRCVAEVQTSQLGKPVEVRAFAKVETAYEPITIIFDDEVKTERLMLQALAELRSFQRKYHDLKELAPIFQMIEKMTA